ncbi:hypothetical protein JB92DRAFT_1013717 [Gautieria morchelliformis]|nr:hypothetical protein JB92DRAFT_1013717 [Gautieria morchelliformis]
MIGLGSNHQDDANTYKDILRSVHSHCSKNLDLSLPMRKPIKAKMVLVELKVCKDFPLLRNFAGGWPVHALIQQYLKNTTEQAVMTRLFPILRCSVLLFSHSTFVFIPIAIVMFDNRFSLFAPITIATPSNAGSTSLN